MNRSTSLYNAKNHITPCHFGCQFAISSLYSACDCLRLPKMTTWHMFQTSLLPKKTSFRFQNKIVLNLKLMEEWYHQSATKTDITSQIHVKEMKPLNPYGLIQQIIVYVRFDILAWPLTKSDFLLFSYSIHFFKMSVLSYKKIMK